MSVDLILLFDRALYDEKTARERNRKAFQISYPLFAEYESRDEVSIPHHRRTRERERALHLL